VKNASRDAGGRPALDVMRASWPAGLWDRGDGLSAGGIASGQAKLGEAWGLGHWNRIVRAHFLTVTPDLPRLCRFHGQRRRPLENGDR
jgi:hypothetical protein